MFNVVNPTITSVLVCTDISPANVNFRLNKEHPSGTRDGWSMPQTLPNGAGNPWPCDANPNNVHYYFECAMKYTPEFVDGKPRCPVCGFYQFDVVLLLVEPGRWKLESICCERCDIEMLITPEVSAYIENEKWRVMTE